MIMWMRVGSEVGSVKRIAGGAKVVSSIDLLA